MGTRDEEAAALQEQQQRATEARLEFEQRQREMAERQAAAEEAARKAAEDALVNGTGSGQGRMVADPEVATPNWPDDGFRAEAPGRRHVVQGALGVGHAGDVAFAQKLLNSGQAPLAGVSAPETVADGAKDNTAGARSAKPALGLG